MTTQSAIVVEPVKMYSLSSTSCKYRKVQLEVSRGQLNLTIPVRSTGFAHAAEYHCKKKKKGKKKQVE